MTCSGTERGSQKGIVGILQGCDDQINRACRREPFGGVGDIQPDEAGAEPGSQCSAGIGTAARQYDVQIVPGFAQDFCNARTNKAPATGDQNARPHSDTDMRYSDGKPWSLDNSGERTSARMDRPIAW